MIKQIALLLCISCLHFERHNTQQDIFPYLRSHINGSSLIWPTRLASAAPLFGMIEEVPTNHSFFFTKGRWELEANYCEKWQRRITNLNSLTVVLVWIMHWWWDISCYMQQYLIYSHVYYLYMKLDMCHVNFKHISVIWQSMCYLLVQFHCAAAMIRTIYIQLTNSETNITLRQTTKGTRDRQ
jgi:hypothetical protein